MINLFATRCCGLFELEGISTMPNPETAFIEAMGQIRKLPAHIVPPFIMFSGVTRLSDDAESAKHARQDRKDNYGQDLAFYLMVNGLGVVTSTEERKNWSTNHIKVWIWHIDHTKANKHFETLLGR